MQALSFLKDEEKIKESLEKAKEFLKEKQENDGSWGNISSTAWAMGGINYLGLDLSGTIKAIVIIGGWVALQYVSLVFLRASGILKEEESHHGNI